MGQFRYVCEEEHASRIAEWDRGGIAIWRSASLSSPDRSWTTPLKRADGTPTPPPHWSSETQPPSVSSSRKVRSALAKAGEGTFYRFDYETREAAVYKPSGPPKPIEERA